MKLIPCGNRVLISPEEALDKTPGGILLPDVAKEKPLRGKVVAVGEGKREGEVVSPISFTEGETVYYTSYAGYKISVDGKDYLVINADEILATIEK